MDWSRAKSILIGVFILVNLLLGYLLWYDREGTSAVTPDEIVAEQALEQIIAQKNIKLSVALPQETPKLRELTIMVSPADGNPGITALTSPFAVDLLREKSALQDMLATQVPDGESYELSPVDSENYRYVLFQMLQGYPIFDMKLELYTRDARVTSYKQLHAEVLTGAQHQEQRVLSALTAVSILADKFLEEGAAIVDVRLGYHGQVFNSESRVIAPFWRVLTASGEQYYVHAITGAVE